MEAASEAEINESSLDICLGEFYVGGDCGNALNVTMHR
jgi:hypothetical protein